MGEPMVKSLYKALKLLFYFDARHPEWGGSELARETGLLKSSVYNILSTFEACDLLQKNPQTGKYRLGFKALELGNVYRNGNDSYELIKGYMDRISGAVGEEVHLARLSQMEVVYIATSSQKFHYSIAGYHTDAHSTAIGKVLLAHLPPGELETYFSDVFAKGVTAHTEHTITEEQAFRCELENVRKQDYALDNIEHEYGVRCVAVPLYNSKGIVEQALSVSGPSPRMTDEKIKRCLELLQTCAADVRQRI